MNLEIFQGVVFGMDMMFFSSGELFGQWVFPACGCGCTESYGQNFESSSPECVVLSEADTIVASFPEGGLQQGCPLCL